MAETQGDRIDVGGGVVGGAGGGGRDGGEQHHGGVHLRVHGGAVPVPRRRPPPRGEQVGQRVHHRAHHRTPNLFITQYQFSPPFFGQQLFCNYLLDFTSFFGRGASSERSYFSAHQREAIAHPEVR